MATLISKGFSCVIFLIVLLSPYTYANRPFKETHKQNDTTDAMLPHKKSGFGGMDCHGHNTPEINIPIPEINIPGMGINVPGLNIPGVSFEIPGVSFGPGEVECGKPCPPGCGCGCGCGCCQLPNAQVAAEGQDVKVAN